MTNDLGTRVLHGKKWMVELKLRLLSVRGDSREGEEARMSCRL